MKFTNQILHPIYIVTSFLRFIDAKSILKMPLLLYWQLLTDPVC